MRSLLLLLLLLPVVLPAQSDTEHRAISLVVCTPGPRLMSTFGHAALCVRDSLRGTATIYDWGRFDFQDPYFYQKFMLGRLAYHMGYEPLDSFLAIYRQEGRQVNEYPLQLSAHQRDTLLQMLYINSQPANRYFSYDFLYHNCATRLRDHLERSLSPSLSYAPDTVSGPSFRRMLHGYLAQSAVLIFGLDLLMGMRVDRPTTVREQMFAPDRLGHHLQRTAVASTPLLGAARPLSEGSGLPERAPPYGTLLLVGLGVTALLTLLAYWLDRAGYSRWLDVPLFVLIGSVGVVLWYMWLGTDHLTAKWNWNVLWANPLYWLLLWPRRPWTLPLAQLLLLLIGVTLLIGLLRIQAFSYAIYPLVVFIGWRLWRWRMV